MKSEALKLHFYRSSNGIRNFGDELSPLFVEMASNRNVELSTVANCDIVSLGSIFEGVAKKLYQRKLKFNFNPIHIWGTGLISTNDINKKIIDRNFHIHAVRGRLTQKKLEIDVQALGDPGLLSKFLIPKQEKKIKILIVPHIAHKDLDSITKLHHSINSSTVADLSDDPLKVLKLIASSDIVISSSLHGLICADSFGIPNIRLNVGQSLKGGDFKFNDYYSSVNRDEIITTPNELEEDIIRKIENFDFSYQENIDNLCDQLLRSFPIDLKKD